ncbi:OmpH family outer membrane protein [Candidatus Aalborgicola defluviihabitans]|uniref:OmpH family outer membrane protein n=1 Tax=Candidatus Aalborgicola defluviihabitans TaxID=3386187 RepID=UPI001E19D8D8|nr:OmpH family outer membrane protein [Burkholderiales bacterium]MBK6568270.1 OmpH family outer membrane protein [Burkholderiales bacterium]MBK7280453.1 OmpH family outer membrane protein [Burkholderiales bacterium]MBK7313407.1 OmpH family outer membrane protein [Burkholderiales bacterium]MBL0244683.1 OmpH family outer membrane protein [Rhodoferax sp.]
MKTSKFAWLISAVLAGCAMSAAAQEFKVGVINYQVITTQSNPAKAAQTKLEQEFSKRQKELTDQQAALKAFGEKFDRDAPTLSESQRANRQKEGTDLARDLQRRQREFQEDLNGRRNEELQQLLERATRAVKQVAEAEKYDMVLQEVVFVNPKHDITDKVLKILNANTASK